MLSLWWVWLAAAVVLGILEILAPSYIFVGFAIGAAVTGGLMWLGMTLALPWTLLVFALVSLAAWLTLRQLLGIRKGQVKVWDRDINED
ncbi:membrane protein [Rhodovulum iodosum]|uniref:Membrane protein n=1 Tax=Rhodovulum iodosum TaxID=68291 RepID=A0ABV3XRG6_9RHOB|nr:hypothetical protein [Rhodovulum robiginosum]RSK32901.1 hypothetical protein EJA01_11275 [Rhodovulum robiginosum]